MKASLLLLLLTLFGVAAKPCEAQTPQPAAAKPFRLVLKAYDGDPDRTSIKSLSFQVDTIDRRQPTEFLRIGEMIPNTRFKLVKFNFKEALNSAKGEKEDVSELTIVNADTGQAAVLVLNKVTDVSGQIPTAASKSQ